MKKYLKTSEYAKLMGIHYRTAARHFHMGKHLCGSDEIFPNLCYIDSIFFEYRQLIPEQLAMGDALAIAMRINKENKLLDEGE